MNSRLPLYALRALAISFGWLALVPDAVIAEVQTTQRIVGSFSTQGPIVVRSTSGPVPVRSLQFNADFGRIVGGQDSGPFSSVTINTETQWAVSSLSDVILDGELRLDARIVPPTPFHGVTLSGQMTDAQETYSIPLTPREKLEAEVAHPHNGGPVVVRSNSSFDSIQIVAQTGQLLGEADAGPFDSVVSLPDRWTAMSDSPVDFEYRKLVPWLPFRSDIEPTELAVTVSTETLATATLSNGYDSITVDVIRDEPLPGGLIGGYSMDGGPVFLRTTEGPQSIRNLTVQAYPNNGQLLGTENSGPFEQVVTNEATEWSVASSADVILDGVLELDLQVERNAFLTGTMVDGDSRTSKVTFNGFTDQVLQNGFVFAAYPEEGGNLMLLSAVDEPHISGVDFVSDAGEILTRGDDPSPFAFFLTEPDNHTQVTLGTLGSWVVVDDVVPLDIHVAPGAGNRLLFASGGGTTPVALPVVAIPQIQAPATCVVPQPEIVGDLDGNGTVEFADFLTLSLNYGKEVATYQEGDTNCNGVVDFDDFLRLGNNYGGSTPKPSSSVPEPTGMMLLLAAFATMACRRRHGKCH